MLEALGDALGFLDAHIMMQRSPHAVAGPFSSGGLVSRYIYVVDDKPRAESGMVIQPLRVLLPYFIFFPLVIAAYIWYFDHAGDDIAKTGA